MKIKNIKIRFDEGHLEEVEITYNKKSLKKRIEENRVLVSTSNTIQNDKESLYVLYPKPEEELEGILDNIKLSE